MNVVTEETHRKQFEERILEHLPFLVLVGNHWNVDFTKILGEEEDEADGPVETHTWNGTSVNDSRRFLSKQFGRLGTGSKVRIVNNEWSGSVVEPN